METVQASTTPFMIDAAKAIGASVGHTSTAVNLGNAWNDLVQPFWLLPALALSKLKLKDIMGYMVIMMIWKPRGLVSTRLPSVFLKERKAVSSDLVKEGHG